MVWMDTERQGCERGTEIARTKEVGISKDEESNGKKTGTNKLM